MFFVSYMCFLSQLHSKIWVTQKKTEKKKHPPHQRWRARRWAEEDGGTYFFSKKKGPHAFHVRYCLCAFPPIAGAGPAWRAGKKRQQPDSLWCSCFMVPCQSVVCSVPLLPRCLIKTSERLVDSTKTRVWGQGGCCVCFCVMMCMRVCLSWRRHSLSEMFKQHAHTHTVRFTCNIRLLIALCSSRGNSELMEHKEAAAVPERCSTSHGGD